MISIICPTFNSEKTIQKTLDSIRNQTFKKIELIIIDGLSTDSTVQIIESNSNIISKYISEKDTGIFDAMNKGLDYVTGEWVYFLGSDDYFHNNNVLENIFSSEINSETSLIMGNVIYSNHKVFKSYFNWKLFFYCSVHHQGIIYRHEIFSSYRYITKNYYPSDYDLNLGLYKSKHKFQYFNEPIAVYALEGESSNVIWSRYKNEITTRKKHIDSIILRIFLDAQTCFRFFVKTLLLKFNYKIHI